MLKHFLTAIESGNLEGIKTLLKEDIVIYSDGGGKVKAAVKAIIGNLNAFKFIAGLLSKNQEEDFEYAPVFWNNHIYLLIYKEKQVESFIHLELTEDSISGVYIQRNPDKLKKVISFVTKQSR